MLSPGLRRQRLLPRRRVHRRRERLYALDPLSTVPWAGQKKPRIVAPAPLRRHHAKSHKGNLVVVRFGTWRAHLHRFRGRARVRHAPRRPGAVRMGLLHRLGPGRHGGARPPRQAPGGRGEAVRQGPRRRPVPGSVQAAGAGDGVVLPDGERDVGQGGLIGSCAVNDEYNADGRLPPSAFDAIDGYLYVISAAIYGKTVKGPNLEAGLQSPVAVAGILEQQRHLHTASLRRHAQVPPHTTSACGCITLDFTRSEKGAAGALPRRRRRQVLDGERQGEVRRSFTSGGSSPRRCCGTDASTWAAGTVGSTAWGTRMTVFVAAHQEHAAVRGPHASAAGEQLHAVLAELLGAVERLGSALLTSSSASTAWAGRVATPTLEVTLAGFPFSAGLTPRCEPGCAPPRPRRRRARRSPDSGASCRPPPRSPPQPGVRQHHRELLAAVARRQIDAFELSRREVGDQVQDAVAAGTKAVVERLEIVEVVGTESEKS